MNFHTGITNFFSSVIEAIDMFTNNWYYYYFIVISHLIQSTYKFVQVVLPHSCSVICVCSNEIGQLVEGLFIMYLPHK